MVETNKQVPTRKSEAIREKVTEKPVTSAHNRADQKANEAAHKAAKTEQEYDANHTTISK